MTIAVTARYGKLGPENFQKLIALPHGNTVIGLARAPKNAEGLGVDIRSGAYDQPEKLRATLAGVVS